MENPAAPATEKQIAYIKELIRSARMDYWRKADAIRHRIQDLDSYDNRHAARQVKAAELMVRVYETIQLPALSQRQASAWIDALKAGTLIDTALDRPGVAERLGLAGLFAEVGEKAIEDALR